MRNKLVPVLALVFGLLAAFMIYYYLDSVKKAEENRIYTQVVVAARDIPINTTVTNEMVIMKRFPTESLNGKELKDLNEALGKITTVPISKDEVILSTRVVKPGESSERLSYVVPAGMRAMAFPVTEATGVANMIKRGDRVDILAVVPGAQIRSILVLPNIQVLAVGTSLSTAANAPAEAPNTITFAVDLPGALKLQMAMKNASTSLVLRNAADQSITYPAPFTFDQL